MALRRSRTRIRRHAGIEPNLTALIDVTFLLIVFFVLVSRINEEEYFTMNLPSPPMAATVPPAAEDQIALNVVPGPDGSAIAYRVGPRSFAPDEDGVRALTAHLASLYTTNPRINLNLRADRGARFEAVEPALAAISRALQAQQAESGAMVNPRVNLMVVKENAAGGG